MSDNASQSSTIAAAVQRSIGSCRDVARTEELGGGRDIELRGNLENREEIIRITWKIHGNSPKIGGFLPVAA